MVAKILAIKICQSFGNQNFGFPVDNLFGLIIGKHKFWNFEKLNKILVSSNWDYEIQSYHGTCLAREISDQTPLFLNNNIRFSFPWMSGATPTQPLCSSWETVFWVLLPKFLDWKTVLGTLRDALRECFFGFG